MTNPAAGYNENVIAPADGRTLYDSVQNPLNFRNPTENQHPTATEQPPNARETATGERAGGTSASEFPDTDSQSASFTEIILKDPLPAITKISIDSFRTMLILASDTMTGREHEKRTVVRTTRATVIEKELTDIFAVVNKRTGEEVEQMENRIYSYTDSKGIRTPYKAGKKSYGNQSLTTVSIGTSAKLLSNQYSLGISTDTLKAVHEALQQQKVLDIDYETYTNALVDDVDFSLDFDTTSIFNIDAKTYLNELPKYLQSHLLSYTQSGKLKNQKGIINRFNTATNQGIEFGDRKSAKPFIKFYLKHLEMLHHEEPNQPAGLFLHNHLHGQNFAENTIRLEITFSIQHLRKYFKPKFDGTLKSLLSIDQNELTTVFKRILFENILTQQPQPRPELQPLVVADKDKALTLTLTGYIVSLLELGKTEAETLKHILKYNPVGRDKTATIERLVPRIYEYQKQLLDLEEYEQWQQASMTQD